MLIFKKKLVLFGEGEGDDKGGGGNPAVPEWAKTLPAEVQAWDEVKNSDSPEKFWQQITNHREFLGQSIRIPSAEAGTEDKKAFYQKLQERVPELMLKPNPEDNDAVEAIYRALGKPEKPEDYPIPKIEPPTGTNIQLDNAPVEAFRGLAHKHGLTKKQFEGIVAEMSKINIDQAVVVQQQRDSDLQTLRTEWGSAFDQRLGQVKELAKKTGAPPVFQDALGKMLVDATTLRWLHSVAESLQGKEPAAGGDRNNTNVLTPVEAQAQIDEMYNNKEHPWWNKGHPSHQAAVKRMLELRRLADPNASSNVNDLYAGAKG